MGRCSAYLLFLSAWLGAGCAEERKSYMRSPLVREAKVTPAPPREPEYSTQAEPSPPPRPVLPDEPSSFVTVPMIQSLDRTPVPR